MGSLLRSHVQTLYPMHVGHTTPSHNYLPQVGSLLGSHVDPPGDVQWDEEHIKHEGHVANVQSQLKEP